MLYDAILLSLDHNRAVIAAQAMSGLRCDGSSITCQSSRRADDCGLWDYRVIERPWGRYVEFLRRPGLVLRLVEINPRERTSLHSHAKRIEHWWLISGFGLGEWDGHIHPLKMDAKYTAAEGSAHCIRNQGRDKLLLLEVQHGLCDEQDVERYDDPYGRPTVPLPLNSPLPLIESPKAKRIAEMIACAAGAIIIIAGCRWVVSRFFL